MTNPVSVRRRREILDALCRGTVPSNGLDPLVAGLGYCETELDAALDVVADGEATFKAVGGEYGSGRAFSPVGWATMQNALKQDFAVAEVQISEIVTPLHNLK